MCLQTLQHLAKGLQVKCIVLTMAYRALCALALAFVTNPICGHSLSHTQYATLASFLSKRAKLIATPGHVHMLLPLPGSLTD